MTNPNYAHLELLIDESGSMSSLQQSVLTSVNGLIDEQATIGGHATISVSTFNSSGVATRLNFALLNKDTKLAGYSPKGMTPLYDAIGNRIVSLGKRLDSMPESERPGIVLFAIMTDGLENCSTDYDVTKVKSLIVQQELVYGWKFMFLGANIDTKAAAGEIGVNVAITYMATPAGYATATRGISQSFTSLRTS